MISVIGIGNPGSAIAEKFASIPQYDVYYLNDNIKKTSGKNFKLKSYEEPEEYEKNIPNLEKLFKTLKERVQVYVVGASYSSSYTLGILEQIKKREIELIYVQPDIELLTGVPRLMERSTFGVLQQYARSGLFKNITLVSNSKMKHVLNDVPIKSYFDTLNSTIFSAIHYLNYFEFNEPEIGNVAKPGEINRIRTVGALQINNLEENWFFELDNGRDLCYYMCINKERLETEGGLHRQIVSKLKDKPKNAFRKVSYAIYETDHKKDFGFCVAHTNAIQENENNS